MSINGTISEKNLRGTCNTGTNNTLTWTYEDLPQEMKDLGFQYKCKVRDKKGDEWRYVTPNVARRHRLCGLRDCRANSGHS